MRTDDEADYPFQRDHRGYNGYLGLNIFPGVQLLGGYSNQWLLSADRRSRFSYLLFKMQQDRVALGQFRFFYQLKFVEDNIIDDQLFWTQPPGTFGVSEFPFADPMLAQNAVVNSVFIGFDQAWGRFNTSAKVKYEGLAQRGDNVARLIRPGEEPEIIDDSHFLGLIHKLDYSFQLTEALVFHPKLKSMYRRQTAYLESVGSKNDLSRDSLSDAGGAVDAQSRAGRRHGIDQSLGLGRQTRGTARFLGLGRRAAAIRYPGVPRISGDHKLGDASAAAAL